MELAWSFRRHVPKTKWKNIDLVLMYTDEVSPEALACAATVYDACIRVNELKVSDSSLIAHKDSNTRKKYAALFAKFAFFTLTDYNKVLYLDADMIVLRSEIINLLALDTPAAVFYGCSTPYSEGNKEYERTVCPYVTHGKLAPSKILKSSCRRVRDQMAFETALVVVTPSVKEYTRVQSAVADVRTPIRGDTGLFNTLYGDITHVINVHFLGRWTKVSDASEVVTLDAYGFQSKPWEDVHSVYLDVAYWRMVFWKDMVHRRKEKVVTENPTLKKAYEVCKGMLARECDIKLGSGLRGMVCLNDDNSVTKYTSTVGDPEAFATLMKMLVRKSDRALVLPRPETLTATFTRKGDVYMMYITERLPDDAIPLYKALTSPTGYPTRSTIADELKRILSKLRALNVVHGDLRPGNIFVLPSTRSKRTSCLRVIDWDSSQQLSGPKKYPKPRNDQQVHEFAGDVEGLLFSASRPTSRKNS
jgi:hypothetical protein